MASWNKKHATLLDAAADDVSMAFRQERELQGFTEGQPTGGRGVSVNERQYRNEQRRADSLARQVDMDFQVVQEPTYFPKMGTHRPQKNLKCTQKTVVARKHQYGKSYRIDMSIPDVSDNSKQAADERQTFEHVKKCRGTRKVNVDNDDVQCLPNKQQHQDLLRLQAEVRARLP